MPEPEPFDTLRERTFPELVEGRPGCPQAWFRYARLARTLAELLNQRNTPTYPRRTLPGLLNRQNTPTYRRRTLPGLLNRQNLPTHRGWTLAGLLNQRNTPTTAG